MAGSNHSRLESLLMLELVLLTDMFRDIEAFLLLEKKRPRLDLEVSPDAEVGLG
jgi:hypothetical protein